MARAIMVGVILSVSVGTWAAAESVTYEASTVTPGGKRHVIASGVRDYSPVHDVVVRERTGADGSVSWSKSLLLTKDLAITASVHRERKLEGFGLLVQLRDGGKGFSWEWFDLEQGQVFRKRQGSGRVSVTTIQGAGYEELGAVEFLDDVVLRYLDDMTKPPGTHTHEVVVRKGSVLKVAP